jgi:hypothetical protein
VETADQLPKTEWQWINRRVVIPTLSLSIGQHPIKKTDVYKYLGYHVDERLSFNEHCKRMLQKVQKNSGILKYVTRSKTSSARARKLISQAFIQPYLQMIYAVWPICYHSVQSKKLKRQIGSCLVSFTIDGMQPMTKFDGYQTTRQQNRKRNASFGDSSTNLKRPHPHLELKQACERDWKSGLIVEFPIIILSVQIKALPHTHTHTYSGMRDPQVVLSRQ